MLRPLPPFTWGAYWVVLVGSEWKPRLTPGTRAARFPNCRPFRGRFSIWAVATTSPTPELLVSMSGASARTEISSVLVATFMRKSSPVFCDTLTTASLRVTVANPARSAFTS